MKSHNHLLLLYDKDCPLCATYTRKMVTYHFIQPETRVAYQDVDPAQFPYVNFQLAQNKIALIDPEQNSVSYGIHALNKIFSVKYPWIGRLLKIPFLFWLVECIYLFISMNRKLMMPVACSSSGCSPSRSWFWRISFITFCGIVVHLIVSPYLHHHLSHYLVSGFKLPDIVFFFGQIVFQYLMCLMIGEKNVYDYLGQVAFVSFLGSLILYVFGGCLHVLHWASIDTQMLSPLCFGVVVGIMFMEHHRRIKLLDMKNLLTYTWLLYRILIYPLVFTT